MIGAAINSRPNAAQIMFMERPIPIDNIESAFVKAVSVPYRLVIGQSAKIVAYGHMQPSRFGC
jgi:hypothetical protein